MCQDRLGCETYDHLDGTVASTCDNFGIRPICFIHDVTCAIARQLDISRRCPNEFNSARTCEAFKKAKCAWFLRQGIVSTNCCIP